MREFFKEFKEFINKGDVMSMAVGIIIGGAFTAIVTSVVENLFTPILGLICGGINFAGLSFGIGDAQIGYGAIIQAVISFLSTAFVLFLILKAVNSLKDKMSKPKEETPAAPPEPSEEVKLLMEIRDALKK